jgi:hypothetical protein
VRETRRTPSGCCSRSSATRRPSLSQRGNEETAPLSAGISERGMYMSMDTLGGPPLPPPPGGWGVTGFPISGTSLCVEETITRTLSHARTHACSRTRERVTYGFLVRSSALNPAAHAESREGVHSLCTAGAQLTRLPLCNGGISAATRALFMWRYVGRGRASRCQPQLGKQHAARDSAGFSGSPSSLPSLPAGPCTVPAGVHRRRQRRLLRQLWRRRACGRDAGSESWTATSAAS